jgi:hypothetical protein
VIKKIGILSKMGEVVEEDKMPPQKYLNNKPQAKLSETQKKQFLDWTSKESGRLMLADTMRKAFQVGRHRPGSRIGRDTVLPA